MTNEEIDLLLQELNGLNDRDLAIAMRTLATNPAEKDTYGTLFCSDDRFEDLALRLNDLNTATFVEADSIVSEVNEGWITIEDGIQKVLELLDRAGCPAKGNADRILQGVHKSKQGFNLKYAITRGTDSIISDVPSI